MSLPMLTPEWDGEVDPKPYFQDRFYKTSDKHPEINEKLKECVRRLYRCCKDGRKVLDLRGLPFANRELGLIFPESHRLTAVWLFRAVEELHYDDESVRKYFEHLCPGEYVDS